MKSYGHIDLTENEMQNMAIGIDNVFPTAPPVGRIAFVDKRLYIAVEIVNSAPYWVPLTNEINTFIHLEESLSSTWTVTHGLNTTTPLVQIYNDSHQVIIPDQITIVDNNSLTVTFTIPQAGKAAIFHGSIQGADKQEVAYTFLETNPNATWVIHHDLGYYPVVRVFSGNNELQPLTVVHNTLFQTTLTFSSPIVGTARLI